MLRGGIPRSYFYGGWKVESGVMVGVYYWAGSYERGLGFHSFLFFSIFSIFSI